jgi:dTDP-glucose 4,6-dehydratase
MTILITGGAGFMGSHFVKYVLERYPHYRVVMLDKLTYAGNLDNLKEVALNPRYTFVQGDIADPGVLQKIFTEHPIEVVVNYAAETHVDRSVMDPTAFLRTNIFGTYHMLEAVRQFGVKRMIQISTDEVFGSVHDGAFKEDSAFEPNSPYAAAKAGGDLLCRSYVVTHKVPVIVTHSCNVYGPNQYPEKLIPLFITNLVEGKKVPLYGDGLNIREWIFVLDHCRAIDKILHEGILGEIYNIGTGEEKNNREVTETVLRLMGKDESVIEYIQDRPGHDRRYAIDHTKLTQKLGWEPSVKFEEGIKLTIEWYEKNAWWWKKIKSGEYLEYYNRQYQK